MLKVKTCICFNYGGITADKVYRGKPFLPAYESPARRRPTISFVILQESPKETPRSTVERKKKLVFVSAVINSFSCAMGWRGEERESKRRKDIGSAKDGQRWREGRRKMEEKGNGREAPRKTTRENWSRRAHVRPAPGL